MARFSESRSQAFSPGLDARPGRRARMRPCVGGVSGAEGYTDLTSCAVRVRVDVDAADAVLTLVTSLGHRVGGHVEDLPTTAPQPEPSRAARGRDAGQHPALRWRWRWRLPGARARLGGAGLRGRLWELARRVVSARSGCTSPRGCRIDALKRRASSDRRRLRPGRRASRRAPACRLAA